jgi:hypothetical protein
VVEPMVAAEGVVDVAVGTSKVWMVCSIKYLTMHLQAITLCEAEILQECKVEIDKIRSTNNALTGVTELA